MTFIKVTNMTIHEINIAQIKNYEGKHIDIDCLVEPKLTELDDFTLTEPIKVCGVIRNFGGTLELDAKAHASLDLTCDRCADNFKTDLDFDIFESFKEIEHMSNQPQESSDEEQNPDIIYFSGDSIDLENLVYTNLVLNLPSKRLCKDSCKGLCSNCGANLNTTKCKCDTRPVDPRFDILDKLNLD